MCIPQKRSFPAVLPKSSFSPHTTRIPTSVTLPIITIPNNCPRIPRSPMLPRIPVVAYPSPLDTVTTTISQLWTFSDPMPVTRVSWTHTCPVIWSTLSRGSITTSSTRIRRWALLPNNTTPTLNRITLQFTTRLRIPRNRSRSLFRHHRHTLQHLRWPSVNRRCWGRPNLRHLRNWRMSSLWRRVTEEYY